MRSTMKLLDYLAKLPKSFSKTRIVTDAKITRDELVEVTGPAFESALKVFQRRKLVNPMLLRLQDAFDSMHPHPSENIIVSIEKGMKQLIINIKELEALVDKTYNNEVAGIGLSYRKANLLQLLESYAFISRYARKLLSFAYTAETASLEAKAAGGSVADGNKTVEAQILPVDIDWLKQNIVYFSQLFVVAAGLGKHKDVVKAVEDIPDVEVTNGNAAIMTATMGKDKVDPFRLELIPIWLNPAYLIGTMVVEWQAARYNAAEEDLRMLQLKKLKLEKRLEGKQDAKLEQQLEYTTKRVNDLEYKLVKMRGDA